MSKNNTTKLDQYVRELMPHQSQYQREEAGQRLRELSGIIARIARKREKKP